MGVYATKEATGAQPQIVFHAGQTFTTSSTLRNVQGFFLIRSCPRMPRQRGDSLGTMSNPDLPVHLPAHRSRIEWTRPVLLPIPGVRTRRLRIIVPTVPQFGGFRLGRRRGPFLFCIACMAVVFTFVVFSKRLGGSDWNDQWGPAVAPPDPSTLVFGREDLRRIWHWEIASGHFPSRASSTYRFILWAGLDIIIRIRCSSGRDRVQIFATEPRHTIHP